VAPAAVGSYQPRVGSEETRPRQPRAVCRNQGGRPSKDYLGSTTFNWGRTASRIRPALPGPRIGSGCPLCSIRSSRKALKALASLPCLAEHQPPPIEIHEQVRIFQSAEEPSRRGQNPHTVPTRIRADIRMRVDEVRREAT